MRVRNQWMTRCALIAAAPLAMSACHRDVTSPTSAARLADSLQSQPLLWTEGYQCDTAYKAAVSA